MKRAFWTSEKILSLAAIFISLCTLIVFLYQTNLIRKQQYMSVYPYLEIYHTGIQTEQYRLILENKGIGPALIAGIKIWGQDKNYSDDFAQYLADIKTAKDTFPYQFSNLYKGRLISANEQVEIIGSPPNDPMSASKLFEMVSRQPLNWELEYESIYGERWVLSSQNLIPRQLE